MAEFRCVTPLGLSELIKLTLSQVGKVREDEDSVCFGYGDSEVKSKPYYIAAYA